MSFFTLRVLLFTAECLLASALLPLLAFAATWLIRRAALRHLVWLTAFGVLAVLPAVALLLPARQIALPAAPVAMPVASVPMTATAPAVPRENVFAAPAMAPTPLDRANVIAARPPIFTLQNGLLLLAALWTAGVFWNLGRMALGAIGLMRLRHGSAVFAVPGAPCEVRLAPASGPATFGILRPLILMPQAAQSWSTARLEAVLAHEAAHVRRCDAVSQALVRLVCAAYWINPLVWLGAQALRREAEMAADDAVLAQGMTPSDYAAELLRLAAETRGAVPGIAMAGSALAARVQAVLAENVSRKGVTRMDLARTLSLGLVATLLLGTARVDLAVAQEAPANPAPVARPAPAAPPPRNVAPKVDIEINRNIGRNIDIEVEAIKARAAAAAAQARRRAEAETDPVKRAQYREEAARVAAEAAAANATADATRQRAAQVAQQAAQTQQRSLDAQQRAQEAQQRALEALQEVRSQSNVDALLRRTGTERMTLSADDTALLAAARERKITISPVEVNDRLAGYMDRLRQRVVVDVAREKLASQQSESAGQTQMERPQPFMVSQVDGKPNYLLRRTFSSKEVSIVATFITPGFASFTPDSLKKVDAAIDAAMTEATGKYEAAWAMTPRTKPIHNLIQLASLAWQGKNVTVTLDTYGPDRDANGNYELINKRNAATDAALVEAYKKIDAAFAEAKAASPQP